LFPKLKEDLTGQNFSSDKEVKAAVRQRFREKEKVILRPGFKNLLNVAKNILKLEEIMWKSDFGQAVNKGQRYTYLFVLLECLLFFIFYSAGGKTFQPAFVYCR
jgi:hypothetical protein